LWIAPWMQVQRLLDDRLTIQALIVLRNAELHRAARTGRLALPKLTKLGQARRITFTYVQT
jgi:hypothetical protein